MGKKTAENLKGGFWWGMCDNNDEKMQNGAVCVGEDKKEKVIVRDKGNDRKTGIKTSNRKNKKKQDLKQN